MKTLVVQFLCAVVVAFVAASGWAKTTTLTIAASGQKWSEGTWDNGLPENGDIVVVNNATGAAAATVNDLVTSLVKIDFTGADAASTITLEGNALSLAGDSATLTDSRATALTATVKLTVNAALTASETSCWSFTTANAKSSVFNGDVFIADDKTLEVKTDSSANEITFNGRIVGANATLDPRAYHGTTHYKGTVDVALLDCKSQNDYTSLYFYAPGNNIRSFVNYGAAVRAYQANAFATPLLLRHDSVMDNRVQYLLQGDQVLAGVSSPDSVQRSFNIQSFYKEPVFVTMKPAEDCSSSIFFGSGSAAYAQVALVYAPAGDVTMRVYGRGSNRAHDFYGPLRVENGTLRFAGDVHFTHLKAVTVAGGTLAMATVSTATPFYVLETLAVGADGTFAVEDDCTDTVFKSGTVDLLLTPGGKISVADGKTLSFKSAAYGGRQLAAGTYTATTADWIAGEGSVVVEPIAANTTYWTNAASGAWNDATKWSSGAAPVSTDTAYVTAAGANYTVSLPSGQATPLAAYVRNDNVHTTTLDPADGLTLSNWKLYLGWGGALDVADGESLTLSAGSVRLDDGARLTVGKGATLTSSASIVLRDDARFASAGTLNVNGAWRVGAVNASSVDQKSVVTSVVTIAGGEVKLSNTITVALKGRMIVSNDAVVANQKNVLGIYNGGGEIYFRDASSFDSNVLWDGSFFNIQSLGGLTVFEDDSKWTSYLTSGSSRLSLSSATYAEGTQYATTATLAFRDRAYFDLPGATEFRMTSGRVVLRYGSSSTSSVKNGIEMCSSGGYHEIHLTNGRIVLGTSSTSDGTIRIGGVATTRGASTGSALVRVDGGVLETWGSRWDHNFGTSGITVGDGDYADADVNRTPTVTGRLELNAGAVTNRQGKIYIGIARSTGTVLQTGGEFISLEADATCLAPVSIGVCNGTGLYTLSNGVFLAKSNVFVGGTPKDKIGMNGYKDTTRANMYPNLHDANGTLSVAAADLAKPCSFTTEKDLNVGADGNGVINLGEGGTITASNVTFRNGAEDVTNHTSRLMFTLGAAGAGRLTASGTVTIQSGTKLTVDASRFTGRGRLRLIEAGAMSGTFAADDITIVGGKPRDCIIQKPTGVFFSRPGGFALLVR